MLMYNVQIVLLCCDQFYYVSGDFIIEIKNKLSLKIDILGVSTLLFLIKITVTAAMPCNKKKKTFS